MDKNPFGNGFGPVQGAPPGLNSMAAQFMALNHPAAAQAAFLSAQVNAAGLPHFAGLPSPVVTSSPNIPGRPEPQQFMKGPNAASMASLEALQRYIFDIEVTVSANVKDAY